MAYIPFTYAPMEKKGDKKYVYNLFSGGVKLSEGSGYAEEGKAESLCNIDIKDGGAETRCARVILSENQEIKGEFHSVYSETFGGKIIMHSGTSLYAIDDVNEGFYEISASLPDKKSLMCTFLSKLYIYSDSRIFSLDSNFELVEEMPYAPLIYDNAGAKIGTADRTDEKYNLCAPVVRVRYTKNYYHPESSYMYFLYPVDADITKPVYVYVNGVRLPESLYYYNEYEVTVKQRLETDEDVVEVVFFTYWSNTDVDDGFEKCSIAEAFGGNMNGGTRLFITGNPDKKGFYYKSGLQDPLCFSEEDTEIIGDGCEEITAMKRMYGDLIIFTKNSVFRMSYNPSYEVSPFAVKEIGNGVGCDCPGSICLIDNRVVFLNSKKGVFIVDSTESTGEQNIKPISGNILSGGGEGILDCAHDSLVNCCSIDFDRKYILGIGNKMYIWDYDKRSFRDSGSYASSQSRLIWYIYSCDFGCDFFYEKDQRLVCLEKEKYTLSCFDKNKRDGVTASFSSGRLGIDGGYGKKQVTGMEIIIEAFTDGSVLLNFYADGTKYCSKNVIVAGGEKKHLKLGLPSKTLVSFAFDLIANSGIRIEGISFNYRNI